MTLESEDDRRKQFFKMYVASEPSLHRFLKLLVHDVGLLEEVVQSVALRLWERFDSFDATRPFDAWARGVAVNVLNELRRSDRRFPRLLTEEGMQGLTAAYARQPFEGSEPTDQLQALRFCLKGLPDRVRELVVQRYCEAQSIEDVAMRSGKSLPATYKALGRALERLADCMHRRLALMAGEGKSAHA
ncbi:sigma-70 family RNA polymerase sigma factor [Caulifigura coniformis]|uniref:sigma-70 family RNA polymerase sigma factor n=1 Tax=Caulifigura coniformis TaxID=2527983 RepID=UPI0018D24AAA|nr:sigma-70 family RNA polymerase sigma factor [Caulifigura coniformis]